MKDDIEIRISKTKGDVHLEVHGNPIGVCKQLMFAYVRVLEEVNPMQKIALIWDAEMLIEALISEILGGNAE